MQVTQEGATSIEDIYKLSLQLSSTFPLVGGEESVFLLYKTLLSQPAPSLYRPLVLIREDMT